MVSPLALLMAGLVVYGILMGKVGTEHWDVLLAESAGRSGRLVLSEFTRNAIEGFKKGAR